ncbi:surface antigen [Plasmodium falciparum UGT5.1]|uniref:Surface antigen n=1 Tax=Plasmodium falciparum UGT5.1 TaxID=1237627 RepID=W7K4H8_PLAFA|nr:surface antigen [Plasmodium falciparum UGT5.1]
MKEVMENFIKQTQQRFHDYDDRMKEKRKQCKEQCDKEIQKIILKDKLEKELMDKFATLQTDIQNDAIPTCVCEKSVADKVEKTCLKCAGVLGGGVMPGFGAIGGTALYALNQLKPAVFKASIEAALNAAASNISATAKAAGIEVGKGVVIAKLKALSVYELIPEISEKISSINDFSKVTTFVEFIYSQYNQTCNWKRSAINSPACYTIETKLSIKTLDPRTHGRPPQHAIRELLQQLAEEATINAETAEAAKNAKLTADLTAEKTVLLEAGFNNSITSIYASIIAIVVIVLILVIIYLILRYRRKKKMKKKLQYIKLLEE